MKLDAAPWWDATRTLQPLCRGEGARSYRGLAGALPGYAHGADSIIQSDDPALRQRRVLLTRSQGQGCLLPSATSCYVYESYIFACLQRQ